MVSYNHDFRPMPHVVPLTRATDFPCTGRFGLLVLTSMDLLDPEGMSAKFLDDIDSLIASYPPNLLHLTVLHNLPDPIRGVAWKALPAVIHRRAEMRFHSARPGELPGGQTGATRLHTLGAEDAYGIYGASREQGLIVVIRPDGYVGVVAALDSVKPVINYLDSIIMRRR